MTKKIGSILLIFTFIISLVGCEKKIETGSISGFDENEAPADRVIDVYIKNLRKKLDLDCITTVKGIGYKFEDK